MKKVLCIIFCVALICLSVISAFVFRTNAYSTISPLFEDGFCFGIPEKTTYKAFKNLFPNTENFNWRIYPVNAADAYDYLSVSDSQYIGTGYRFVIEKSFSQSDSYDIVVPGDVSGDGIVDSTDYICLKRHILRINGSILSGAYLKAGDMNGDSKISATDYLRLKRYFLGMYSPELPHSSESASTEPTTIESERPWYPGWH